MREGNVLSGVCHSVHRERGCPMMHWDRQGGSCGRQPLQRTGQKGQTITPAGGIGKGVVFGIAS